MAHVATRQEAPAAAHEGSAVIASLAVVVASSVALASVAPALVLLPVLSLLIGLGVILLPEGTRCGPPGK